uniref:Uncharacterized protein n=1 Tax=Cacopsylla melanoneura TaxID=428564 RepID=A0A8D8YHW7_9HEMI
MAEVLVIGRIVRNLALEARATLSDLFKKDFRIFGKRTNNVALVWFRYLDSEHFDHRFYVCGNHRFYVCRNHRFYLCGNHRFYLCADYRFYLSDHHRLYLCDGHRSVATTRLVK